MLVKSRGTNWTPNSASLISAGVGTTPSRSTYVVLPVHNFDDRQLTTYFIKTNVEHARTPNLSNWVSTAESVGRIHKLKTNYHTHIAKNTMVYVKQTSPTYISCRLESWISIIQSVELTADVLTTYLGKTLKNVWEKKKQGFELGKWPKTGIPGPVFLKNGYILKPSKNAPHEPSRLWLWSKANPTCY